MSELKQSELIHISEHSRLVSDNFTQEAVTAAYVEALAALRAQTTNNPLTTGELTAEVERLTQSNKDKNVSLKIRQAHIDALEREVERLTRENSAAIRDLEIVKECVTCKYAEHCGPAVEEPAEEARWRDCYGHHRKNWEWHGAQGGTTWNMN